MLEFVLYTRIEEGRKGSSETSSSLRITAINNAEGRCISVCKFWGKTCALPERIYSQVRKQDVHQKDVNGGGLRRRKTFKTIDKEWNKNEQLI